MTEDTNVPVGQATPQEAEKVDLEKLRDEKVIPIARAVLNDMAVSLIPDDANKVIDYNPIVMKIMQRTLEADLNISMECSYLFQVMLSAISGLSSTVQKCETTPINDVRYGAIGKKMLAILAMNDIPLGNVTKDDIDKGFVVVKEQIQALFKEESLSMLEIKYIMDNIFASFKTVNNMFSQSLEAASSKAEAKLFGVDSMSDVTVGKLDKVLTAKSE